MAQQYKFALRRQVLHNVFLTRYYVLLFGTMCVRPLSFRLRLASPNSVRSEAISARTALKVDNEQGCLLHAKRKGCGTMMSTLAQVLDCFLAFVFTERVRS